MAKWIKNFNPLWFSAISPPLMPEQCPDCKAWTTYQQEHDCDGTPNQSFPTTEEK